MRLSGNVITAADLYKWLARDLGAKRATEIIYPQKLQYYPKEGTVLGKPIAPAAPILRIPLAPIVYLQGYNIPEIKRLPSQTHLVTTDKGKSFAWVTYPEYIALLNSGKLFEVVASYAPIDTSQVIDNFASNVAKAKAGLDVDRKIRAFYYSRLQSPDTSIKNEALRFFDEVDLKPQGKGYFDLQKQTQESNRKTYTENYNQLSPESQKFVEREYGVIPPPRSQIPVNVLRQELPPIVRSQIAPKISASTMMPPGFNFSAPQMYNNFSEETLQKEPEQLKTFNNKALLVGLGLIGLLFLLKR